MRILFADRLFERPVFIIECYRLKEIKPTFARLEKALEQGYHLAGFLSYEAGYAFEEVFHNDKTYDFPLVCFGAYRSPHPPAKKVAPFSQREKEGTIVFYPLPLGEGGRLAPAGEGGSKKHYIHQVRRIKRLIAAGETYQVNHTFKQKFSFNGQPSALFHRLKARQPTDHSALIETDKFSVLSLSPELFFSKRGEKITVKPMKGTIAPGRNNDQILQNDAKNRSENIMIVDLLRNDLGRVAQTGTVQVKKLFEVEKHPTLYQMTSTIEAKVASDIELYELFRNIFPSGSVTGAPKVRAMQVIRELEQEERKIYTGSIGYITPNKDMHFNVAIRTLLLTTNNSSASSGLQLTTYKAELGLGSGIVADSNPEAEYAECLLKGRFLAID
jgi:para-aminobenzoate synthetase/4-amino-4-deoxychorismate lyase